MMAIDQKVRGESRDVRAHRSSVRHDARLWTGPIMLSHALEGLMDQPLEPICIDVQPNDNHDALLRALPQEGRGRRCRYACPRVGIVPQQVHQRGLCPDWPHTIPLVVDDTKADLRVLFSGPPVSREDWKTSD